MTSPSWMLTAFHQAQLASLLQFPVGLCLATFDDRPRPVLLVKAPKEAILAAKVNGGFKIYVVPVEADGETTACLVSAFFDDADEPLVLMTPLFDEPEARALWQGLLNGSYDVHFFNELNQEMLGYTVEAGCTEATRQRLRQTKLLPFDFGVARSMMDTAGAFMGLRDASDDADAIDIDLREPIFPEDIFFLDMRPHLNDHQASKGYRHTTLEREEPGQLQELDIIGLLRRTFPSKQIYHGPLRVTDGEEIADVVVITDSRVLFIQAKDSPNTSEVLGNTMSRKKATSIKRLAKAARQAKGAIGYARSSDRGLVMKVGAEETTVSLEGRTLFSLLVVKELFNDMVAHSDPLLLELSNSTHVPCVALDYPELVQYTSHLADEAAFFEALHRVHDFAMENGTFPRLRFGLTASR